MVEQPSIQTELKIGRSYLLDAEAKLHDQAEPIFGLARFVYGEPVPVATPFTYGRFFGNTPALGRQPPPLDIGTKTEYRKWLEEKAQPIYRDLTAAVEHLRKVDAAYPGAALIENGAPRYAARAMLAYGYLLLGDYFFYRCSWAEAVKTYKAALKLDPGSQEVLFHLALAYVNDGDMGRAHNFLERGIELAPSSDTAVEAHKHLERLTTLGPRPKIFHGSPGTLKGLIAASLVGFLVCLACICCGLLGGWAEVADEAGDATFAAAFTIAAIVVGGLCFLVPAGVTAIYYFAKRK